MDEEHSGDRTDLAPRTEAAGGVARQREPVEVYFDDAGISEDLNVGVLLAAAELRDRLAEARDTSANRRDMQANLDAIRTGDMDEKGFADRRMAMKNRAASRADRTAAATDRAALILKLSAAFRT